MFKKILKQRNKERLEKKFMTKCYSQEGEDLILETYLENQHDGFFVDVGAYHPIRFSNSYLFYQKGWRGINIDPMPKSMEPFNEIRPEDINLELAVGLEEADVDYFIFDEPALNSFSSELSNERHQNTRYKITDVIKLKQLPLAKILSQYMPENRKIDFLNIDAEGYEINILKSNDWSRYVPTIILTETNEESAANVFKTDVHTFLSEKNYDLIAKTYRTSIYRLK